MNFQIVQLTSRGDFGPLESGWDYDFNIYCGRRALLFGMRLSAKRLHALPKQKIGTEVGEYYVAIDWSPDSASLASGAVNGAKVWRCTNGQAHQGTQ